MKQLFSINCTLSSDYAGAGLQNAEGNIFEGIKEILHSLFPLHEDSGKSHDYAPFVVAEYFYSPTQVIVWIWHHAYDELIKILYGMGSIVLPTNPDLRISCQFSAFSTKGVPSCCLEVRWKKNEAAPHEMYDKVYLACQASDGFVTHVTRQNGSVIQFSCPEAALNALAIAKAELSGETSHTIRSISLTEHCVVGCKWSKTDSKCSSDCQLNGPQLATAVQEAASHHSEHILILKAQSLSDARSLDQSSTEVTLIVPTSYDVHILRSISKLSIGLVDLVVIPCSAYEEKHSTGSSSPCPVPHLTISPPQSITVSASMSKGAKSDDSTHSVYSGSGSITNGAYSCRSGSSDENIAKDTHNVQNDGSSNGGGNIDDYGDGDSENDDKSDEVSHLNLGSPFTLLTRESLESHDSGEVWLRASPHADKSFQYSDTVELRDAIVAALFKNLREWKRQALKDNSQTAIEISKNQNQHWIISVTGCSQKAVAERVKELDRLVMSANKNCDVQELAMWEPQHIHAITNILPLSKILQESQSAVIFTHSDKSHKKGEAAKVVVDICALDSQGLERIRDYLCDLYPKRAEWKISHISSPLRAQLSEYAVFTEVSSHDSFVGESRDVADSGRQIVLNAWGFGSSLKKAHEELVSKHSKEVSRPIASSVASPTKPATTTAKSPSEHPKHKATFTFQDREAGVYYQAFESEFRIYMRESMSVEVLATELAGSPEGKKSPANDSKGQFDVRAPAVKIMLIGSTLKDVQKAKNFYETYLNTSHLARCQINFPRTSVDKYKELLLFKQSHDKKLRAIRENAIATATASVATKTDSSKSQIHANPLHGLGFINIRIKPPLHSKGIKRMQLPCDVTVTLCGPYQTRAQLDALKDLEKVFNAIPSEYCCAVCELPAASAITRQLTVKVSRETFVKEHNLAGLKFDEGSKNKGGVAVAKIWATQNKNLQRVLDVMKASCPESKIKPANAMPSQLPDFEESSPYYIGPAKSYMPSLGYSSDDTSKMSPNRGIAGRDDFSLGSPGVIGAPPGLGSGTITDAPSHRSRTVIHWPHLSLRFVFLCDPFKSTLTNIIQTYRSRGIVVTLPYRDKADPTACMLLEGESGLVATCARNVIDYMDAILGQQKCVQVLLVGATFAKLTANDLCTLKEIQGCCGVHIVLEPTPEELQQAAWRYDTRVLSCTAPTVSSSPSTTAGTDTASPFSPIKSRSNIFGSPFAPIPSPVGSATRGQSIGQNSHGSWWQDQSSLTFFSTMTSLGSPASTTRVLDPGLGARMGSPSVDYFGAADSPLSLITSPTRRDQSYHSMWSPSGHPAQIFSPRPMPASKSSHGDTESNMLLAVHVHNKQLQQTIEVAVVSNSEGSCAGLQAECLLLIVDESADACLSPDKIAMLNRGQPIVDMAGQSGPWSSGPSSPNVMIRVRPLATTNDASAQHVALSDALLIGLHRADMIRGNRGLVIVAPAPSSDVVSELSQQQIQQVIASKTLQFAQDRNLQNIRRLVLLVYDDVCTVAGGLFECNFEASGLSGNSTVLGNAYASTILSCIEEEHNQLLSFFDIKIIACSIPMPVSMPINAVECRKDEKVVVVLLRGQPQGILNTVRELAVIAHS